jgi:hypothetical protein
MIFVGIGVFGEYRNFWEIKAVRFSLLELSASNRFSEKRVPPLLGKDEI